MPYQIKASTSLRDLSGVGDELLLDAADGSVLAWFWNGNFVQHTPSQATDGQQSIDTITHWEAA